MASKPRRAGVVGIAALALLLVAGAARKFNVPTRVRDRVRKTRKG